MSHFNFLNYVYIIILFFMLTGSEICFAQHETKIADGFFYDNINNNESVIIFVSGLAGDKTWGKFIELIKSDQDLNQYDLLVYDSPDSKSIEQHVDRIKTILFNNLSSYSDKIFVAHSIGGFIVKRFIIKYVTSDSGDQTLTPNLVITYGTPLKIDKFSISTFKRIGARIFWFSLPKLKKEVFNLEVLEEINEEWRTRFISKATPKIDFLTVFGTNDKIAEAKNEDRSTISVAIPGDHLEIVTPQSTRDCSFKILKGKLQDRTFDPNVLTCVLK